MVSELLPDVKVKEKCLYKIFVKVGIEVKLISILISILGCYLIFCTYNLIFDVIVARHCNQLCSERS